MSETETHSKKKRRVKQACDYCRLKKAKCDGKTPVCSTCVSNSEECTYTQSSKRRGLPTGYTHDLEKKVILFQALFASLITESEIETQGSDTESEILNLLTDPGKKVIQNINYLQTVWDNHKISNQFNKFIIDNNSIVHDAKTATQGLKSLSDAQQQQEETSNSIKNATPSFSNLLNNPLFNIDNGKITQDYNLSNDMSFFLQDDIFQFIADEMEESKESWEPVALQFHGLSSLISGFSTKSLQQYNSKLLLSRKNPFRVGSIFNVSSAAISASRANTIKLPMEIFRFPSNLRDLVENYFQIYHTWIPMLDRVSVIRQTQHFQYLDDSNNRSSFQVSDCSLIALVWALMALGNSESLELSLKNTSNEDNSALFAKNAIMALENSLISTIETIQAMLLLGIYFYQQGEWDYSWVLISSSTRMAIDVRLMTPAAANNDNNKIKEELDTENSRRSSDLDKCIRERTWSTVYVLNTLLSARMGRTPLIRATDWPIPNVGTDNWEIWEARISNKSSDVIELDSSKCLVAFNHFVKVISILNLAITCTIDTLEETLTNDEGSKLYGDVKSTSSHRTNNESNKHTLAFFFKLLNDCLTDLPEYCKLSYFLNQERLPSLIAFLHLTIHLTWCILAIRLSSLKPSVSGVTTKDKIIKFRNQQYTKSVLSMREIVNVSTVKKLKHFPFIDYFILMGLNFPKMLDFDKGNNEALKSEHNELFRSLLVNAALTSIPCKISWDLYKIMNGIVDDLLTSMSTESAANTKQKSNSVEKGGLVRKRLHLDSSGQVGNNLSPFSTLFNPGSSIVSSSEDAQGFHESLNSPSTMTSADSKDIQATEEDAILQPLHEKSNKKMGENILHFGNASMHTNSVFTGLNPLYPPNDNIKFHWENQSKSKFSTTNEAPRDELDLFMLDTEFSRNDSRLNNFMRNLGYINYEDNGNSNIADLKRITTDDKEKQFVLGSTLPNNSGKIPPEYNSEDIELNQYLQKIIERNA